MARPPWARSKNFSISARSTRTPPSSTRRDGSSTQIKDISTLTIPAEEPEDEETSSDQPVRSGIRSSLQQRIRELEHTLFEERRALESLEERYSKLEAKYVEIVKQRP